MNCRKAYLHFYYQTVFLGTSFLTKEIFCTIREVYLMFFQKKKVGSDATSQITQNYKKGWIDFGPMPAAVQPRSVRFVKNGDIWSQVNPSTKSRAVILCAGDLMCEPAMSEASFFDGEYDFRLCFKQIAPVLKNSDLALANLETMVTELAPYAHTMHRVKHHGRNRYHCNAPVAYLDALRYAGFDGFAMANNHCADGGYEGLVDTINNVDGRGFMRTGVFKNAEEPRTLLVDVNGIRLGILSYTEHINRNLDTEILTAEGCEVMMNRFTEEKLKRDIQTARKNGAEFILCYMHVLGKEYSHEVLPRQRELVKLVANAGVDCVMCSHTHSIQEYEAVKTHDGRHVPVVHSLGNFITSDGTGMITRTNVVFKLVLEKVSDVVRIADESYIPCRVVENILRSDYKVFPTQAKYRDGRPSKLLEDAQNEISRLIGNLRLDEEIDTSKPVISIPSEESSFETKRSLTVGKICNIAGISTDSISPSLLNKNIDYYTARYTWVKKGCAYFSRYLGSTEEQEARWAYERGASVLFCSKPFTTSAGTPMPCIVVQRPSERFYDLNRWVRSLYDIPVIGITGSVGKTTTKEMLFEVLNAQYNTLKNTGNANTYAAIADTTQKLQPYHELYLQEICAFSPKWVEGGARMLGPKYCIITNIGYPHVDLYGSIENILYDKTSLIRALPEDGVAFLNYDDERLKNYQTDKKVISFGIHNTEADFTAKDICYGDGVIRFTIHCAEGDFPAVIYMVGEHNVLNALAAFAVGRRLDIPADTILKALAEYRSEGMRQNVLNIGGYNLYVDCYNSAPNSVLTSVHALSLMQPAKGGKKVAVIGDIPRLGASSEEVHRDVGEKLIGEAVDLYLFFGPYTKHTYDVMVAAGCNAKHTESREQLNNWVREHIQRGDYALFKAGHPMALAKTIDQVYGTSLHITDGDVLLENSKDSSNELYRARWIDEVVELRSPKTPMAHRRIPSEIGGTAVGRIGNEAFSGGKMTELTLPETVYNIGFAAFYKCSNLKKIHFTKGLRILERSAFNSCRALEEVILPDTLIDIGEKAFAYCSKLRSMHIPSSVGHISEDAFDGCKDLITIYCKENSYAHNYALRNSLKFVLESQ